MNVFDVLGDPVRRRILEFLADGEQTSGSIADVIRAVEAGPLSEVDAWPDRFRKFWDQRLDALESELARGRRTEPLHRRNLLRRSAFECDGFFYGIARPSRGRSISIASDECWTCGAVIFQNAAATGVNSPRRHHDFESARRCVG